jgi:hypothetical protein
MSGKIYLGLYICAQSMALPRPLPKKKKKGKKIEVKYKTYRGHHDCKRASISHILIPEKASHGRRITLQKRCILLLVI